MKRLWALMLATVRDGVRSQVFFNLLVFGVFAMGASLVMEQLSLGEHGRALMDVGLALLSVINALLCVSMAVRTMGGEEDRHTLLTVVVRPVSRTQVLCGKYLGLCALACINTLGAGALLWLLGQQAQGVTWERLAPALLGLMAESSLVIAVTLLFCTLAGTTVSLVMGLCTWVVGLAAGEILTYAQKEGLGALGSMLKFVYYAVPNLGRLDFNAHPSSAVQVLLNLGYAGLYAAAVLALASLIFEKRDLR